MSDLTTKRLLKPFIEAAPAPMFFSSFFQSPPENFHASEEVEIDVQRDGEDVAIAITDLASGASYNANDLATNKAFKPPVFKERGTINAFKLITRNPGESPYESTQSLAFQARAINRSAVLSGKMQRKIRRSIELQAAQVMQTGQVTLLNEAGVSVYGIDYSPKTTHNATVDVTWAADGTGGDRFEDVSELADVIRGDGLTEPDVLIFGRVAWQRFIKPEYVQKAISRDGIGLGALAPKRGRGATFQGYVWIGNYRFECWTYNGRYRHPQTGASTQYMADAKLVMASTEARLDLTYGSIPRFVDPSSQALSFMPQRISDSDLSLDFSLAAWLSQDGESLTLQVGSRPLCIPTQIDSFGSLDIII